PILVSHTDSQVGRCGSSPPSTPLLTGRSTGVMPARQTVTAALMACFFMVGNGLALVWTLTSDSPYMHRGMVVALVAVSSAMLPVVMWGLFKLPRVAVPMVVAATTVLVALAIWGGGDSQAPISFLFLWAIPYTMAFFNTRQAGVQIVLVAVA